MKKALYKDSFKEIKNTYKRFISILLMAFLGVGFFAGIRATSPDMLNTINKYYNEQNVYDIQTISTLGLTNEDVQEISRVENVNEVIGTYEIDGKLEIDNKEIIAKVMCIENINIPVLIDGSLPQNKDECVVEESFLEVYNKKIGDIIDIEVENVQNDNGDEIKYLKNDKVKIVGTVKSPMYISRDRGTSKLGAGKINYYIYILKDNVNATDIYTNVYIKVKDSAKYITSSDKYKNYIEQTKNNIEHIKEQREKARHDNLVDIANKKVEDAEKKLNIEKQNAQEKLDEAEKKIKEGKNKLQDAENKIIQNEKKANKELANAWKQIEKAKEQISNNEQRLKDKKEEANKKLEELEKQKQSLKTKLQDIEFGLSPLKEQYNQVLNQLNNLQIPEHQKQILEQKKVALEEQIQELEKNRETVESTIKQIETVITSGRQEMQSAQIQLENAKRELAKNENTYYTNKQSTYAQINSAKTTLEKSRQELAKGEEELQKNKEEFEIKIKDAEGKLIDAKNEIAQIENPKWYILDRNMNSGYSGFIQDTQSIENIGKVFPIVFFIVATLISLTSMTRMVEEQRTQIGTLKALGYNKIQIAGKYIIYASLACVIGGFLGMSVGFILLPQIIWMMYEMMYQITDINLSFNCQYGAIGLILIFLCIVGATICSVMKELVNTPANLMRPKAPKMGKRVLLEKISFIWNRLSFSRKVTVRNIFRYKKRFLMTIIGICGCTSLILAGFGVKDSIKRILPNQFEKVFKYDMQINLKSGLNEEQRKKYISELNAKEKIETIVETYMTSGTAINNGNQEDIQIIIPKNEIELRDVINVNDIKTQEQVNLKENEICLTDKIAQLLRVSQGDTITLKDNNDKETEIKISNIVENYVSHYVYMSKATYENLYNEKYETNVLLTRNKNIDNNQEEALAKEIMEQSEVASITRMDSIVETMDDMLNSLNYVVVILIISAGLLDFVVLYNLSNVNISERIRELATIKVLGFYDKEVYSYITRETVILTAIGILLGLVGGYFLNYFIIGTCEINMLRFSKVIEPISYLYSTLITITFTVIVNLVTYFALKKIDMIESLKSVE